MSHCLFAHHISHMHWQGIEPMPPRVEAGNCLRHGTAVFSIVDCVLMFAEDVSGTSDIFRNHLRDRGYPSRKAPVCVMQAAATFLSNVQTVRTSQ